MRGWKELHGATAGKELKVRYQPVVDHGYHTFERTHVSKSSGGGDSVDMKKDRFPFEQRLKVCLCCGLLLIRASDKNFMVLRTLLKAVRQRCCNKAPTQKAASSVHAHQTHADACSVGGLAHEPCSDPSSSYSIGAIVISR